MQYPSAQTKLNPISHRVQSPAQPNEGCKILAKQGLLNLKNLSSGLAILLYSEKLQLGALFHLPLPKRVGTFALFNEEQSFAKSALTIVLSELQSLGVCTRDLLTYAIGGSSSEHSTETLSSLVRHALSIHGLRVTALDLGGHQIRSIWMDVATGRIIVRSELTPDSDCLSTYTPMAS